MQLIKKIVVENRYSGNGWNFEKTTKYIFETDFFQLEAGYFEHYFEDKFVKAVIELPVSYGCPAHCRFCATSGIEKFKKLEPEEMRELLEFIWKEQKLDNREYVLLSVTGTGDLHFNFPNVLEFLLGLTIYENLHVTLSSCLWNENQLSVIEELSEKISIRNVQITCVGTNEQVLRQLIPVYEQRELNFKEVLSYIEASEKQYYRVNYILIRDKNDSIECMQKFRDMIVGVKEKVIVRITKLNETGATKRNDLYPTDLGKMEQFKALLTNAGIRSYLFYAYKNDHMNCGQLITEKIMT